MAGQNTSAHSLSSAEQIAWFGIWWLIGLFGVFGNALIVIIFFKYKQLRKNDYMYLLFGLALFDLIGRVSDTMVAVPAQLYWTVNKVSSIVVWHCGCAIVLPGFSILASQIMTIAIAADRYELFARPFAYNNRDHKKYALRAWIVACLYGGGNNLISIVGVDMNAHVGACTAAAYLLPAYKLLYLTCVLIVSSLVIGYFAAALYLMRKRLRELKAKPVRSKNNDALLQQVKASRVVMYTILLFLLVWVLPNFLFLFSITLSGSGSLLIRLSSRLVGLGANLNGSANVLVYYIFNRHMRKYLLKFMCCSKE